MPMIFKIDFYYRERSSKKLFSDDLTADDLTGYIDSKCFYADCHYGRGINGYAETLMAMPTAILAELNFKEKNFKSN